DEVLADLGMQREKLRELLRNFRYQAMTLFSQELSSAELPTVPGSSEYIGRDDQMRQEVLITAGRYNTVRPEELREIVEKNSGPLGWKNPNAVIATILSRSRMWERKEDGTWVKKPEPTLEV